MFDETTYFVHEDDWGMITFIPSAARAEIEGLLRAGAEIDARQVPAYPVPGLTVDDLATLFLGTLEPAEALLTGRTTEMRAVESGFALFHELIGAIYGTQDDGEVTALYFDNRLCDCDHDFSGLIQGIYKLAGRHDLSLVDWWLDMLVALDTAEAVRNYVEES